MAAELVETSRLFARTVARIDPDWIEGPAEHLLRRYYSEPHWEKRRGAVMAFERVTLYGVPIVAGRKVLYARVDPAVARDLFIRRALVEGDWETSHRFFHDNRALIAEIEELEQRSRRRDILVDDEVLFDFYDARIPSGVVSSAHFDSWWKKARRRNPRRPHLERNTLVRPDAEQLDEAAFPDRWESPGLTMPLSYEFDPGTAIDGVTVDVPLARLADLDPASFEWQIPGLRAELVTELIRTLPKALRRNFIPAPDHARAVLERIEPGERSLLDALGRELHRISGSTVPREAWRLDRLPPHLRLRFRVVDDDGRMVGEGQDLAELQQRLRPKSQDRLSRIAGGLERSGLTEWIFDELPRRFEADHDGHPVVGYPALVDEGSTVGVRVLQSRDEQALAMRRGTRRLLLLAVASPVPALVKRLDSQTKLTLSAYPHGGIGPLLDDCVAAAVDVLVERHGGPAWDEAQFDRLRDDIRAELHDVLDEVIAEVQRIVRLGPELSSHLAASTARAQADLVDDVGAQLDRLLRPGFVTATGVDRLPHVLRYLRAIEHRLERAPLDLERDLKSMLAIHQLEDRLHALLDGAPTESERARLADIGWMIEELRVSLFAQRLGTAYPISEKRVRRALENG